MKWLLLASMLCGCSWFDEHGSGGPGGFPDAPGSPPSPSDARDQLCGGLVMCGPDRHCEAQCQAIGTAGCANPCHVACVPDTPCSAVDCGSDMTCVDTGVNDCFGMAWQTSQHCEPTTSTVCEAVATETACMARTDCAPIYRGAGCSCAAELCSCADPQAEYVRCRPI
jgi:hypothetical protein